MEKFWLVVSALVFGESGRKYLVTKVNFGTSREHVFWLKQKENKELHYMGVNRSLVALGIDGQVRKKDTQQIDKEVFSYYDNRSCFHPAFE